jgi:hypothetical protein
VYACGKNVCMYLHMYVVACLFIHLFIYLFIYLFMYLFIYVFIYLFMYLLGPRQRSPYSDLLRSGRFGVRAPVGTKDIRFSTPVQFSRRPSVPHRSKRREDEEETHV